MKLAPRLQSEISSVIRTQEGIPELLALPGVGPGLEDLLCAIFLLGYGYGADEGVEGEIGRALLEMKQ